MIRIQIAALAAALLTGACVGPTISPVDFRAGVARPAAEVESWGVADVSVEIPDDMDVSNDPDIRYPASDKLVWYGDPPGDRKAQVRALMAAAARKGAAAALRGDRPVNLTLRIRRFHAMTPLARATNLRLGVHEIMFDIAVADAASGAPLAGETGVEADFRAYSGEDAVLAEARGETQKLRITERVSNVVRAWLTAYAP